jgi:hypothetical protein
MNTLTETTNDSVYVFNLISGISISFIVIIDLFLL